MNPVPPDDFMRQLAETVTWCAGREDLNRPRECLRSGELQPHLAASYEREAVTLNPRRMQAFLNPELKSESAPDNAIWLTPSLVGGLVGQRRRALTRTAKSVDDSVLRRTQGRLLLSLYEFTNHNGGTEYETGGYLDVNDVPPWDTWVADIPCVRKEPPKHKSTYSVLGGENLDRILVAWVPEAFVALVHSHGIETECMGMLAWADDLPTEERMHGRWSELVPTWLSGLRFPRPTRDGH